VSNVISSLEIDLKAKTASFSRDMKGASQDVKQFGKDTSFSMQEARGSLALLGEEVGIRIPRHLQTFIAMLPGVGEALNAAFNSVAILALIGLVVEIGRKIYEFYEKAKEEAKEYAIELDKTTRKQQELGEAALLKQQGPIASKQHDLDVLNVALSVTNHFADQAQKKLDNLHKSAQANLDISKLTGGSTDIEDFTDKDEEEKLKHEVTARKDQAAAIVKQIQAGNQEMANLQSSFEEDSRKDFQAYNDKVIDDTKKSLEQKAQLFVANYKAQASNRHLSIEEIRAIDSVAANTELKAAKDAADAHYDNDRKAQEALISEHQSGSEADSKIRESAQVKLKELKETHDAAIEAAEVQHQIKMDGILTTYNASRIAQEEKDAKEAERKQKEARDKAQAAALADLRDQEKISQDKLALANEQFKGEEDRLKAQVELHQISAKQELDGLLKLHKAEYDAEVVRLNEKVEIAAKELVIEANKNGQILSLEEARLKAQAGLEADYSKAKIEQQNKDAKSTADYQKQQQKMWDDVSKSIADTIAQAALFGRSWTDALKSIIVKLIEMAFEMKKINGTGTAPAGGAGGSGIGGFFKSLFSGFFADGGVVGPGQWGIAGENGPEPVFGGVTGTTVFPTNMMSSSSSSSNQNVYHIDARGADIGVEQRIRRALHESEERAVARSVAVVSDRTRRKS
jgi:hypothetical protein